MAQFLDELTGDFVVHTRSNTDIANLVGSSTAARIHPNMLRQGTTMPAITYVQTAGHAQKSHSGRTGCKHLILNVYAWSESQPEANQLAALLEALWLDTEGEIGAGTKIHVCNGGIEDSGSLEAKDSSDVKKFWVRLVLRMLIA